METASFLWLLAVAGGPLLLAILIGYALTHRRRLNRAEKAARDAATRDVFDERP